MEFASGFPRPDGRCHVHIIPVNVLTPGREFITVEEIEDTLTYLKQPDTDLVYGDLIVFILHSRFFKSSFIYDGKTIIGMDKFRRLPSKFQVIRNDVPIDYWNVKLSQENQIVHLPSGTEVDKSNSLNLHTLIVWFELREYTEEAVRNVRCVVTDDILRVSTTFTTRRSTSDSEKIIPTSGKRSEDELEKGVEITYEIVYCPEDSEYAYPIEAFRDFKKLLSREEPLPFELDPGNFEDLHLDGSTTLYLNTFYL